MNPTALLTRRFVLAAATSVLALTLAGCATKSPSLAETPPIVFVHGNGDTAALWQTTVWRFESNGWPASACTPSTCPTPSRATTMPRPSRAALPRLSTWPT